MKRKPPPNQTLLRERFAQQMSRTTLARKTGISTKTILRHETQGTRVRLDNAGRIARALGKDVNDLFDEDLVIG